ncbi:SAM-dependent methyltransferase [bacterium]|jgi:hypothetical protein|nr:methyltransferase [Verrucomicrobiota bacterium]MDA7632746.1 SAM-dependent methyltransferase [bacterium]MDA7645656.1 SAM-dependent methyltransferase [bacterium]
MQRVTVPAPSQTEEPSGFKFFHQLNAVQDLSWANSSTYITRGMAERYFDSDRLGDKLVRALAIDEVIPVKEILESCEFFERVRKEIRAETIADLCCGHGLLGILFAVFERRTKHVILIDTTEPPCHNKLLKQVAQIAPWIQDNVQFKMGPIDSVQQIPHKNTSIVSSHACGMLTDECIEAAVSINGSVAVMPCCYPRNQCPAPRALQFALGHEVAFDVDRTYRLENANYHVRWTSIPKQITPMNRIIIGRVRSKVRGH